MATQNPTDQAVASAAASVQETKTPRKPRKVANLATAKTADGALAAPRSVYGILGISNDTYRSISRAEYTKTIKSMNLIDLQDEAYRHGVLATNNRDVLLDRLERKFVQAANRFPEQPVQQSNAAKTPEEEETRQKALDFLSRGR